MLLRGAQNCDDLIVFHPVFGVFNVFGAQERKTQKPSIEKASLSLQMISPTLRASISLMYVQTFAAGDDLDRCVHIS